MIDALYDAAAPALRLWLPTHRPAFDDAVRRAVDVPQRSAYTKEARPFAPGTR